MLNEHTSQKFKISPVEMKQRNKDEILFIPFNEETINDLQKIYYNIPGEPRFLTDFLNLRPSRHREGLKKRSELYPLKDYGNYTALTMPNPPFTNHEQLMENPKNAKNNDAGFAIVTWFLHPTSLEGTFFEKDKRSEIANKLEEISKSENLRLGKEGELENINQNLTRSGLKRINSFSAEYREPLEQSEPNYVRHERTGIPYLAATVDINPEHLPMLKEFKQDILEHLKNDYGVDEKNGDQITMYFHLFHSKTAVTLHMHTRVNQRLHPFEEENGLFLDDVIKALEEGKSVKDMIVEKGYHYSVVDPLLCDNFKTQKVNNLFKVPENVEQQPKVENQKNKQDYHL